MPIDVFGFIEVARFDDELGSGDTWNFCVDIMPFPLRADDVCAIMFGIAKWKIEWSPVADSRGIPPSIGRVGKRIIEEAMIYQEADKPYGYTYITYEEIKQIDWRAYPDADLEELEEPFGWYSLLKTMDALSACFQAQRLVVWFQW